MRRVLLLPLVAGLLGGCQYVQARGRDFLDIFRLEGHMGPGLQADTKLTDLVHLGLGSSRGARHGFNYGVVETHQVMEHHFPVSMVNSIIEPDNEALHTISWDLESTQHRCYILLPGVIHESTQGVDALHFFDVELGLYVLFPGARIGLSPGELLDFILGIWTFDLAGDDPPPARAAKRFIQPIEPTRGPLGTGTEP